MWHYGDPLGEQRAAMSAAVVVDRSHRAVLELTGGERKSWLHNISTQHVSELADGAVTQNLSLDGQGRVEDHWIQTELGGVTYLDTEPWRGEPLLTYLRKMVFWAEVVDRARRPGGAVASGPPAGRRSGARRARASVRCQLKTPRRRCPAAASSAGCAGRASKSTWSYRAIRPPTGRTG